MYVAYNCLLKALTETPRYTTGCIWMEGMWLAYWLILVHLEQLPGWLSIVFFGTMHSDVELISTLWIVKLCSISAAALLLCGCLLDEFPFCLWMPHMYKYMEENVSNKCLCCKFWNGYTNWKKNKTTKRIISEINADVEMECWKRQTKLTAKAWV